MSRIRNHENDQKPDPTVSDKETMLFQREEKALTCLFQKRNIGNKKNQECSSFYKSKMQITKLTCHFEVPAAIM